MSSTVAIMDRSDFEITSRGFTPAKLALDARQALVSQIVDKFIPQVGEATLRLYNHDIPIESGDTSEEVLQKVIDILTNSPFFRTTKHTLDTLHGPTSSLNAFERFLMANAFITVDSLASIILGQNLMDSNSVLATIQPSLSQKKKTFYKSLIVKALTHAGISATETGPLEERLAQMAFESQLSLTHPEPVILDMYRRESQLGDIPDLVSIYLEEIKVDHPSPATINEMVQYLIKLNLNLTPAGPGEADKKALIGQVDEFFGAAYVHALKVASGQEDPIDKIFSSGSISTWNFEVDYFTKTEQQGISPENILAAGALDYIYELGDKLGIFRVTDALVLMWAQGRLELSQARTASALGPRQGEAASKLYRYYKLRDSRLSAEERAMIYRQVLNKGNANLLARMVPNGDFTQLWEQLMSEVVDYIQKSERHYSYNNLVSRSSILQSTRNLQYNLTFNMVGKPLNDVHELYAQLQECISILGNSEIVDQLSGGGIKNMWTVIDKVSRQELGSSPNISASRTAAVEGHKIYKWIANYEDGRINEQDFTNFLNSAEAYIIAQGQMAPVPARDTLFDMPPGNGSLPATGGDEFDDWD